MDSLKVLLTGLGKYLHRRWGKLLADKHGLLLLSRWLYVLVLSEHHSQLKLKNEGLTQWLFEGRKTKIL